MTYDVANRADHFKVGDAVKMGSGEEGVVKQYVTSPTGFHSYRVEVTSGPRKGAVVTATAPAMSRRKASRQAALVRVGGRTFTCRVARSPREHAQGLQGSEPLSPSEGLLFVFDHPRPATFHMGTVSFPIDIAFIEKGRVARVVRSAQPGSKERWSYPRCDAVLETAAGCAPPAGARISRTAFNEDDYWVEPSGQAHVFGERINHDDWAARHLGVDDPMTAHRQLINEGWVAVNTAGAIQAKNPRAAVPHAEDLVNRGAHSVDIVTPTGMFTYTLDEGLRRRRPAYAQRTAAGGWSNTLTLGDREYAPLDVEQHKDDAHSNAPREVHDIFFPDGDEVRDQTHDDDRFRDRSTPDVSSPNRMDNPAPGWEQQLGYDTVHFHDDQDAPAFRPSAAFHIDASKRLNKFLDRLGLTADLPEWMEQDHASKAWLLRTLRNYVKDHISERASWNFNDPDAPQFYSPEGPTTNPKSITPDNIISLGGEQPRVQKELDSALSQLRQLQPYIDHGDKLGVDWSSDNTPLNRVGTLVKEVKKSKGPREGLADFEVLSPYVTKINSAHAATLIHGAEKSTKEEGDYGWCTGWFWNDYFDQYTGRESAEIYLVRTGPATEKKVINGKEVLLASKDSRDIFNVYVGANDAEVQAPDNNGIKEDEFEEVIFKLRDAGADKAADLLEEHQEQGQVEGMAEDTVTMYVVTLADAGLEGTVYVSGNHGRAERFAYDAEACDNRDVDIWEVTIPRSDEGETDPTEWEVLDSNVIDTVQRDPIEFYMAVEGTDDPTSSRIRLLSDPVESDNIEVDELLAQVMRDDALRAKAIANGMSIWGVSVHPRDVEWESPEYWSVYNSNNEYEFEPVDDESIVIFPIDGERHSLAHDGKEISTGTLDEMENLAVQLIAREPRLSVYHNYKDVTAMYVQRAKNLLNPTPNVGQQSFDLGEENAPFGDQPEDDDTHRLFHPETHERLATVTVTAQDLEIADPVDLIVGLIQGMTREARPLDWHRDALNANLAYAIVEPSDVASWVGNLGMSGSEATDVLDAATSPQGMQVLGDGLVLAGLAKIANIAREDGQHLLVLWTDYNDVSQ